MSISKGKKLPDIDLLTMGKDGPEAVNLAARTKGRKVVLFGLPGAYTGTCENAHVPSFIRNKAEFDKKGIDEIICVAVNDPFVLKHWAKHTGADVAGIAMLGDPEGTLTKALDMEFSAKPIGLVGRSKRYGMLVDDGFVTVFAEVKDPGKSAEELLALV